MPNKYEVLRNGALVFFSLTKCTRSKIETCKILNMSLFMHILFSTNQKNYFGGTLLFYFQCIWKVMMKLFVWDWCDLGIGVLRKCLSTRVFGRFLYRSFFFSLLTREWNSLHITLITSTMLHLLKPILLTQDTILYHMKQDTEINE